ncbi:UDP-glucose 4-epimerase family protein [Pseudomonas sp. C5pp]|uniref:UDP-glucose 4-epimerase family protein n=1 Tax=Pseudomonas sp. C5pp TaxID=1586081 RepID=UPI00057F9C97|nr:SDR family oxidoreductase [Pseudomonas sp. C5pp]KIC79626.1 NAD-dependent dehydratase [Pseudomonas sp. C5pp]
MNCKVFLTGASGFVGGGVLRRLVADGVPVVAAVRHENMTLPPSVRGIAFESFEHDNDWSGLLAECKVVIHAAARVHVMSDTESDPLAAFRRVNVDGTLALARQAIIAGVKRFVFISSIKVNGEGTCRSKPYFADDVPQPQDPYGLSKLEAETALLALARESGLEVVIVRPVLVYGSGVKANFLTMMRWLDRRLPLPFGAIDNRRSLVALENLVDLIVTCINHPAAVNQIFLVSDGEDLSTTELLRRMGSALGKPARLLPVPASLICAGAAVLGKAGLAQRLCGSLQVDINKTRDLLGWHPPVDCEAALQAAARHYQGNDKQ